MYLPPPTHRPTYIPPPVQTCPHCGYCPTCGRSSGYYYTCSWPPAITYGNLTELVGSITTC
jgi:hypothetical protein